MNKARYLRLKAVLERRQPDLTVLMEQVHKSHNFSAILRNCDAAGVLEAHAVPPLDGLPIHGGSAGGTHKWVKVHTYATTEEAVERLQSDGFALVAADPGSASVDYRDMDFTGPTAFVMGSELHGLSEAALALVDQTVRIPMAGMAASLNVSVATAVLLFEAFRQRQTAGLYDASRIDAETRNRLLFEWSYPRIAGHLRRRGIPYPALTEDGVITDPSALDPLKGRKG